MAELTEQEQIQVMQRWLKQYGPYVLAVFVIGGGVFFGNQWWQSSQDKKVAAASDLYAEFVETMSIVVPGSEVSAQRLATARAIEEMLRNDYEGSLYGVFAASELARVSVLAGDLDTALSDLQTALQASEDEGMNHILRSRIARVLQEQGKLDEALSQLENPDSAFEALFARQRGSIYQQLGETQSALAQYRIAQQGMAEVEPNYASLLQMLIDQLEAAELSQQTN